MMRRCLACGVEKDMELKEIYPYPDDMITTEEPISPMFDIDCQMDKDRSDFRIATVCFHCYHKLEPDMWISQSMWEALNPITPANDLPMSLP